MFQTIRHNLCTAYERSQNTSTSSFVSQYACCVCAYPPLCDAARNGVGTEALLLALEYVVIMLGALIDW